MSHPKRGLKKYAMVNTSTFATHWGEGVEGLMVEDGECILIHEVLTHSLQVAEGVECCHVVDHTHVGDTESILQIVTDGRLQVLKAVLVS